MKITCNRRDDIIKRRDEYEADYNARKQKHDEQYEQYRRAEYDVLHLVEEEVGAQLASFRSLQFDIRANRGRWGSGGMSIYILCNENTKFSDDVALAWRYEVELDKAGDVTKESSSWSGLKATTEAQMQSLIETVEALKYLNSVDWATVLNKELPKYDDYVTEHEPSRRERPNFERELFEADLAEAVGTDAIVKGKAGPSSGYRQGVTIYYMIHKETPAQYAVSEYWGGQVDETLANEGKEAAINLVKNGYQYRIKKETLEQLISSPIEIIK